MATPAPPGARPSLLLPLVVLFFASGACGLVYQVLWLRLLALVFGVTVYAASTVLASFMAGLALGSWLGGRLADRVRRPLLAFGVAEVLVGATALATPWLLELSRGVHDALAPETAVARTAARVAGSLVVLLVPTVLMGSTLPLVLRSSLARTGDLGRSASVLYAANTAGAIAGTLACGYWMIGAIGIAASFQLTAATNVALGLVAIFVGRRGEASRAAVADADVVDPVARAGRLLAVFAVSGFCALALEVVWFRMLLMFLPGTTYAFTTMLATVLGGIALGSATVRPRPQAADDVVRVGLLQLAAAVAVLVSSAALSITYARGWRTSGVIQACVVAILPAAFLLGRAYPLALRVWSGAGEGVARRAGLFGSANLGGGIVGSLAAGFVVLPALGSRHALVGLAALLAAAGLVLTGLTRRALALAAAFAALAVVLPDPFTAALGRRYKGEQLVWREEGLQGTVTVHAAPGGRRVMYIDGIHQADDSAPMLELHRRVGQLALVLHPDPRRVLFVGLGGGASAGEASLYPGVQVDVVELSPSVLRGAAWFRHVNHDVLARPNVFVRLDDGRHVLQHTTQRYDVVIADPIHPHLAGAGFLDSAEYYRLVRGVLEHDGLMLQWVGHGTETKAKLAVRTFLSVFPDTSLWGDSLLVGGMRPLDVRVVAAKWDDPRLRPLLAGLGLHAPDDLVALRTAGPAGLRRFAGEGPVLTDDQPRIEYYLSLPKKDPPVDLADLRAR